MPSKPTVEGSGTVLLGKTTMGISIPSDVLMGVKWTGDAPVSFGGVVNCGFSLFATGLLAAGVAAPSDTARDSLAEEVAAGEAETVFAAALYRSHAWSAPNKPRGVIHRKPLGAA